MKKIQGKSVVEGVAKGKFCYYQPVINEVVTTTSENHQSEWDQFVEGRGLAKSTLEQLREKMVEQGSSDEADILEAHMMMMDDVTFEDMVKENIWNKSMNAAYAVSDASKTLIQIFNQMDNQYMKERALDLKDVTQRIIQKILHPEEVAADGFNSAGDMIILGAKDLMPSETIQMDKSKILAILTEEGTANSHTVIIARSLNIPAIIGIGNELHSGLEGKEVIVDGEQGCIYVDPDEETVHIYEEKANALQQQKEEEKQLIGLESVTQDGRRLNIYANIGSPEEAEAACRYDAEGIGLFRSEFLFLDKQTYPSEEEQFEAYKDVAVAMEGRRVIVRTIDIGADKQVDYFNIPKEENPAMGYRAIRICLEEQGIFRTQLRALYRASAYGRIAIMFPMIISVEEVIEIKSIIQNVQDELKAEKIAFNENVELGIMIETPASVVMSSELSKEVDFFSIGTNDLTQYTLALDRQNPRIERFYNPHHPAILRMIKYVVDSAHENGKWVGVCGELGGDFELLEYFMSIGLDEVSIAPAKVLKMRKLLRSMKK